jgi:hypothetical protein
VIRGIVGYSIQLVTISESRITEQEKAGALADYLDDLLRPVLAAPRPDLHLTEEEFDEILARVREQKKFLEALNAAQPIIDEIARASTDLLDNVQSRAMAAGEEVDDAIEREHNEVRRINTLLREAQLWTFNSLIHLGNYRTGDKSALDSLFAREPSLYEQVSDPANVTKADLQAIEKRLLFKLSEVRNLKDQIEPELELYRNQQQELDDLVDAALGAIKKARVSIVVWSRVHRRMAAGITDPSKINMFGITKKVVDAAL